MFIPVGSDAIAVGFFTASGVGATLLTVTLDVYEITTAGSSQPVTNQACTEVGGGLYRSTIDSLDIDANAAYVYVFKTAGTADQQHIAGIYYAGSSTQVEAKAVELADDIITGNAFDESTAYPLKSADTGATQVARVGADGDTLETLSDQIDGIGAAAGVPTLYAPTAATRVIGDDDGGDFTNLAAHDDSSMVTGENGASGMDVTVTRGTTDIAKYPSVVRVAGYYSGATSHQVDVYMYNYSLTAWERAGTMLTRSTPFNYIFPAGVDNSDPVTGEMKMRFLHATAPYNPSHALHLDYVSFEKVDTYSQIQSDVAAIYALLLDVDIEVDDIAEDTGTTIPAAIAALNDISPAEVNAEVDTALADYDAPTFSELDAAQLAIQSDIAALNNLSAAEVNAEVDTALGDYDGPTKAELDAAQAVIEAAIGLLNDITVADIVSAMQVVADDFKADVTNVTVGDILQAALAKFATTDTGETGAVAGSVAALSKGAISLSTVEILTSIRPGTVRQYAGSTWSFEFPVSGLEAADDIWLYLKDDIDDPDDEAVLGISMSVGLEVLNKETEDLEETDAAIASDADSVNVTVEVGATSELAPGRYKYGLKASVGGSIAMFDIGDFTVLQDIPARTE